TPNGTLERFAQNADGSFTPPTGIHDTLVQNGDGSFDLTYASTKSSLHFGSDGSLQSITDDYGNVLNLTYSAGKLQQIADAAGSGRYLNVSWGPDGRISTVQDSSGRSVQYAYNAQGALATVTNPVSQVTTYGYLTGRFGPILHTATDNWGRL